MIPFVDQFAVGDCCGRPTNRSWFVFYEHLIKIATNVFACNVSTRRPAKPMNLSADRKRGVEIEGTLDIEVATIRYLSNYHRTQRKSRNRIYVSGKRGASPRGIYSRLKCKRPRFYLPSKRFDRADTTDAWYLFNYTAINQRFPSSTLSGENALR